MALKLKQVNSDFTTVNCFSYEKKFTTYAGLSVFVAAFVIYLSLNLLMAQGPLSMLQISPKDFREKDDVWWAMHNCVLLKEKPEIFF